MKISVLPMGEVEENVLKTLQCRLVKVFSGSTCKIMPKFTVPKECYNIVRQQYNSTLILRETLRLAELAEMLGSREDRALGVVDVDLYAEGLNFVFGEAQCPGKVAVISLYRLRPEFYGAPKNEGLLIERAVKEAVHELGHTFGLRHCLNPLCVMHFSLHIGMTDRKQAEFCISCNSLMDL
ncbi:archaemetzincin family Zn-dependent metalloprotease [Candidatus Bathyarchaeota archaeon]|nr:archaemetzincin family Zn-dependent metalloprotease [Candidatus Bathyarchaeota archaeon]